MKVGILAGGVGSRLSEETVVKPKPMVEIGGQPILWHIMMYYSHFGFHDFAIALGYKGEYIKRYMADYCSLASDLSIDLAEGIVKPHSNHKLNWHIDLIDTGQNTQTGGRIKRMQPYFGTGTFMLTWGDGVSTVDLHKLLEFQARHRHSSAATSAIRSTGNRGEPSSQLRREAADERGLDQWRVFCDGARHLRVHRGGCDPLRA
jgi:glucose-1-phosphate cytidylyltransferase